MTTRKNYKKQCPNCGDKFNPWQDSQTYCSHDCMGEHMRGERHPLHKEDVSYHTVHNWLGENYDKSGACDHCEKEKDNTEFALKRGCEYKRDRDNFLELCISCHRKYDYDKEDYKRIHKALEKAWNKNTFLEERECIQCGKKFKPPQDREKHCSLSCSNKTAGEKASKNRERNDKGQFV